MYNLSSLAIAGLIAISPFLLSGCANQSAQSVEGTQADMLSQAEASTPKAPISKGQEIFLTNCVACHQGSGNPPGPNAIITGSSRLESEQSFNQLLRKPTSPMMRAFSKEELSDAQVHELYAYLKSVK